MSDSWIRVYKILYGTTINKDLYKIKRKLFLKAVFVYLFRDLKSLTFGFKKEYIPSDSKIVFVNVNPDFFFGWPLYFRREVTLVHNGKTNHTYPIFYQNMLNESFLLSLAYIIPGKRLKTILYNIAYLRAKRFLNSKNIQVLFVGSHTLLSNLLLAVGHKLGIKTIVCQHGIYQLNYKLPYVEQGYCSDVIVWGKLYRKIYANKKNVNIVVLPTLKNIYFSPGVVRVGKIRKVLFVGSADYKIDDNYPRYYRWYLEKIIKVSIKRQLLFVYRPHPREDLRISLGSKLLKKMHNSSTILINEKECSADWVIGFFSTFLVELYLGGNFVSQILHKDAYRDLLAKWYDIRTVNNLEDFQNVLDAGSSTVKVKDSKEHLLLAENPSKEYFNFLSGLLV